MNIKRVVRRYSGILLFSSALITALVWGLVVNSLGPVVKDAAQYDILAQNLLAYRSFSFDGANPTMDREPGYPLFLAFIYLFFGHSYAAVYIIQIILFGLLSVLIYRVLIKIFDKKIAFFSALGVSLFYGFGYFATFILTEMLAVFLLVLSVFFLIKAQETNKNIFLVLAGLSFGYLALVRSIALLLIIFATAALALINCRRIFKKDLAVKILLLCFSFALVAGPWAIRNYYYFGTFLTGGRLGNVYAQAKKLHFTPKELSEYFSAYTLGTPLTQKIFPGYIHRWWERGSADGRILWIPPEVSDRLPKDSGGQAILDPDIFLRGEYDKYFVEAYKRELAEHRLKSIILMLFEPVKLNILLSPFSPGFGVDGMFSGQNLTVLKTLFIICLRIIWFVFFGLIVYGIKKSLADFKKYLFLLVPIIYFNGIYMFFDAIPRYSLPLYPFYFVFFFFGLKNLFEKFFLNKNENFVNQS